MKPFRGIFAIPQTPFTAHGDPDEQALRRIVDFTIECGADGLVYPVNASEFNHLSDMERIQLTRVVVEHTAGRIPMIAGVSGVSAEVASHLASSAREVGADALIALPPYARRAGLAEQVVFDYYQSIATAGRRRCEDSGYSYQVRIQHLLRQLF